MHASHVPAVSKRMQNAMARRRHDRRPAAVGWGIALGNGSVSQPIERTGQLGAGAAFRLLRGIEKSLWEARVDAWCRQASVVVRSLLDASLAVDGQLLVGYGNTGSPSERDGSWMGWDVGWFGLRHSCWHLDCVAWFLDRINLGAEPILSIHHRRSVGPHSSSVGSSATAAPSSLDT